MGATATAFKVQSGIVRGVQGARAIATASQGAAEGVEMTSLLSAEGAGVAAEGGCVCRMARLVLPDGPWSRLMALGPA